MLLNLTTPDLRSEIRTRLTIGVIRSTLVTLLVIALLAILISGTGVVLLQMKAKDLAAEANQSTLLLQAQGQSSIAETTLKLNSQILALQGVQKRFQKWSPVIEQFAALTPAGVTLESLSISQGTNKLTFSGTAATREAYTNYEKVLQNSSIVADVIFPLQTKRTDLEFSLTASMKKP
ncbi:MAG: PilN domain-containing protein [Patescibacteria group bacterium]